MADYFVKQSKGGISLRFARAICLAGLLALICLSMYGCEKSSNPLDGEDSKQFLSGKKPTTQCEIVLMPTGNTMTDTENLQNALMESAMSQGGTICLGPGTFYVHSALVRQSFDPGLQGYCENLFMGTIKGAGKDMTIIKAVRGSDNSPFGTFFDLPAVFMVWDFDYFGIRDLSFESESELADLWEFPGLPATKGLLSYVNLGSGIYGVGGQIGTDCINVRFNGSLNSEGMPEIPLMWECYGGGAGVHNMKSCEFINGNFVMMDYGELEGATINLGGSPIDRNTYTNTTEAQVYAINAFGVGDCKINISHIEINNAGGFGFWSHSNNTLSSLNFLNNNVNMFPESWFAGIELWVMPETGSLITTITQNRINSDGSFIFGPIFAEGVQDMVIANNRITGSGPAAIYLGVLEQWPGSATLLGNNLQNWKMIEGPEGFVAAPIWVGPNITNALVVGGHNGKNVFDEAGDEPKHNVFTGVNNMNTNVGQEVKSAMQQILDSRFEMINRSRR